MNWDSQKDSFALIEINKTKCPHCEQAFFEISGEELSHCPSCELEIEELGSDNLTKWKISVDHRTGEIKSSRWTGNR